MQYEAEWVDFEVGDGSILLLKMRRIGVISAGCGRDPNRIGELVGELPSDEL